MTITLGFPWWVNAYVAVLVFAARCGFDVDTERAARFIVNRVKVRPS